MDLIQPTLTVITDRLSAVRERTPGGRLRGHERSAKIERPRRPNCLSDYRIKYRGAVGGLATG
jgi:hypothetical protein